MCESFLHFTTLPIYDIMKIFNLAKLIDISGYLTMILILICLITNQVEHLFIGLLAFFLIPFFLLWLFLYIAQFSISPLLSDSKVVFRTPFICRNAFVLQSSLLAIHTTIWNLFWLIFRWYIFFYCLIFSLSVSICLRWDSFLEHRCCLKLCYIYM